MKNKVKIKKVAIIGVGLIGGSIGKALLERKLADKVIGICRRKKSLERAIKAKSISTGFVNNFKVIKGADIVFIATPVQTIKKVLKILSGIKIDSRTIVTDTGSTKKEICDHGARFSKSFSFVGAHPLAGSEKEGVEYAASSLFNGSLCILTPHKKTNKKALYTIRRLWQAMGANVGILTPEEHDRILAFTSHLPHIIAYALSGAQKETYLKYTAGGFRDMTRIALSSPELWSDIFMSNRSNMLRSIDVFEKLILGLKNDIKKNREEDLRGKLVKFKKIREKLSTNCHSRKSGNL